jgi:hypothetical protein
LGATRDDQPTVLGAQRVAEDGDGAAVLGARRGKTDDGTNTAGRFAALGAAALGAAALATSRKKEEN